jgi:hypothetical protein
MPHSLPQIPSRKEDAASIRLLFDALRTTSRPGRIEHIVTRDLIGNRRDRLGAGLIVPGAEAGKRLIEHEDGGSVRCTRDQALDLLGAFRRGDDDLGAAIAHDIGDFVLCQIAADRGVIKSRALRGPADLHESETVLHQ